MCRSTERVLHIAVAHHPDSRSWAIWSTAFDEVGQGSLYSDVKQFADDVDGRAAAVTELAAVAAEWYAGFSVKRGAESPHH